MSTVCWEPGCGVLVEGGSCWCLEHAATGCRGELDDGSECKHLSHYCEEPVHFCEAHGGEPR